MCHASGQRYIRPDIHLPAGNSPYLEAHYEAGALAAYPASGERLKSRRIVILGLRAFRFQSLPAASDGKCSLRARSHWYTHVRRCDGYLTRHESEFV